MDEKGSKGKAFLNEAMEAMASAEKMFELQAKIQDLPFYAIFKKKKLQKELTKLNLEQAQKGKKKMEEAVSTISEIFDMFEEERSPEETDKLKEEINNLSDRQARIALLAILDYKPLEEAIEIGKSYTSSG